MLRAQDFLPEEYQKDTTKELSPSEKVDPQASSAKSSSFLVKKRNKIVIPTLFVLFLIFASIISLYLLKQNQDVRQQAYGENEGTCDNSSTTAFVCRGKPFNYVVYACNWQNEANTGLKCVQTTDSLCAAVPFQNNSCTSNQPPPSSGTCTNTGRPFQGQCIKFVCDNGCDSNARCGEEAQTSMVRGDCSTLISQCSSSDCCQVDAVDDQGTYCVLPGFTEVIRCSTNCGRVDPSPTSTKPTPTPTPTIKITPRVTPTVTPTITPTVTQAPVIPTCGSIAMLSMSNTLLTGDDDQSLALGDQVKFQCSSINPSDLPIHYEFRVLTPDNIFEYLAAVNTEVSAANISSAYTISSYGQFYAQARVCYGASTNFVCQEWEAIPGVENLPALRQDQTGPIIGRPTGNTLPVISPTLSAY